MPVRTQQVGDGRVFVFTCDVCGAPAAFGTGVNLREALRTGDVTKAGKWFCGWRDGQPVCVGRGKERTAVEGQEA